VPGFEIGNGLFHPQADVPGGNTGGGKYLRTVFKSAFRQPPEAVDFGDGRTNLDRQEIQSL